jgi:hypothetical protein
MQEMTLDEISVPEVKLPNLKMVQVHIGADRGEQVLNFLRFVLRNGPFSVARVFSRCSIQCSKVFFQEDCSDNMHDQLLDLDKEISKSRLYIAKRKWSIQEREFCQSCRKIHHY